jgi:hypothetical protein
MLAYSLWWRRWRWWGGQATAEAASTLLLDVTASEIIAAKRTLPASQSGSPNFWLDKSGEPFNLYYNLNDYGRYKSAVIDYQAYFDRCKTQFTAALGLLMSNPSTGFFISGDSIIHGGGASSVAYSYLSMIKNAYPTRDFKQATFPGRSLNNLVADQTSSIYTEDLTGRVVIFAWGMNDQVYRDPLQFRSDFRAYVSAVKARGAVHIIVFSTILPTPEWNISNYETIISQNEYLAAEKGTFVTVLNITDLLDPRINNQIVLSEVNHPSNYGHMSHWFCFKALVSNSG